MASGNIVFQFVSNSPVTSSDISTYLPIENSNTSFINFHFLII